MQDIMVPCKKCGNKVTASSLKLDLDEGKVICPDCIKNKGIHKEIQQEVHHKAETPKFEKSAVQEEKSNKVGHKCNSCGYKFMINVETKSPKYCPYCNARVMTF